MFAGGLILGFTLLGFALWLHQREAAGWDERRDDSELDQHYFATRASGRRRVHVLFAASGSLILVAAFFGPGFVWGVCWMLVSVLLLLVVLLAAIDAVRTQRYHSQKLPEIRRQLLDDDKSA